MATKPYRKEASVFYTVHKNRSYPLSKKTKLLIAIAYDAAHGAANGVRSLAQDAIKAGATREEIGEALRVAYVLSGIGSVYVGSQGLKELFP